MESIDGVSWGEPRSRRTYDGCSQVARETRIQLYVSPCVGIKTGNVEHKSGSFMATNEHPQRDLEWCTCDLMLSVRGRLPSNLRCNNVEACLGDEKG